MARGNMLPILAGCMLLANICLVQADRNQNIHFEIFEHESSQNELEVFGPESSGRLRMFADRDNNRGKGFVYSNRVTQEQDSDRDSERESERESERIADVSGLYFYINNNQAERVSTINFRENAEINEDRRFANAQLHLRGVWNSGDGQESRKQELAIVGGTRGLAGARGVVRYERLEKNTYRVTGDFQVRGESQSF